MITSTKKTVKITMKKSTKLTPILILGTLLLSVGVCTSRAQALKGAGGVDLLYVIKTTSTPVSYTHLTLPTKA